MNPELLLAHFDRISGVPDAILRLRRFVLDLAVRGKLVEQSPNDESSAALLMLNDQARRAIAEKDRRSDTNRQVLLAEESRWNIPPSWNWSALADLVLFIDYRGKTPTKAEKGVRLITAKNVKKGFINVSPEEFLSEPDYRAWMTRGLPKKGDILFTTEAPMGNAAVVSLSERFALAQRVICFRPYGAVNSDFLMLQLLAEPFQTILDNTATGLTAKGIKAAKLRRLPVAVPPLAEQHRIVAKVDELLGLCDRLKAAQHEQESRQDRLTAAALHHLSNGGAVEDFRRHASFYLARLPRFTTRPAHLMLLRETILNLAVRGKLVPQEPTEEPGFELLRRIREEKERLIEDGKVKKEKPLPSLTKEEEPFSAPVGWTWVRLDALAELITKGSSPKWQGVEYVSKEDGILFITSENVGNYRLRKLNELKYVEKRFNEIESRSILRDGDLLLNLVGASIGRTAVYELGDIANINQAVALVRLVQKDSAPFVSYLLHYFNSPLAIRLMLASRVTTAQPNMSLTDARQFPVPVPPLAEQVRIVSKLNELMTLCDRLEERITDADVTSSGLLEAVLHHTLCDTSMRDAPHLGVA